MTGNIRRWTTKLVTDTVFRNSMMLIAARIGTKIATSILLIYVARSLGDIQFGLFSTILTLVGFFGIVEEFGFTVPLIRRIAHGEQPPGVLLGELVALKGALGIVAFIGLLASTHASFSTPAIMCVFSISMVLEVMNLSLTRGFEGREQMRTISIILLSEKTVLCVAAVGALMSGAGLFGVGVAYIVSNIASMLISLRFWKKGGERIVVRMTRERALVLMKEALPFAFAAFVSAVYVRIDTFFLAYYRPFAEVGWYNAAFRITDAQLFIPSAIVASVFPILSRTFAGERGEFIRHYRRTFSVLLTLGLSIAVVCSLFAQPIITLLYGRKFEHAADSFRILSWMMPLYYVNFLIGNALIAMGKEKISAAALTLGAVINISLNVFAVKEYGQVGASTVKIITEVFAFLFQLYFIHRVLPFRGTYAGLRGGT